MSQEYFFIEEVSIDNPQVEKETDLQDEETKKGLQEELRLHEIEQQLEMAETRCNTLKGQVNYMKMIYNGLNQDGEKSTTTTTTTTASSTATKTILSSASEKKPVQSKRYLSLEMQHQHFKQKREEKTTQEKHRKGLSAQSEIKADKPEEVPSRDVETTGERIIRSPTAKNFSLSESENAKQINSIISGITRSVNRLSQLQVHMDPALPEESRETIGVQTVECSKKDAQPEKPYFVEEVIKNLENKSKSSLKRKIKIRRKANVPSSRLDPKRSNDSVSELKKKIKSITKIPDKKKSSSEAIQYPGKIKKKSAPKYKPPLVVKKSVDFKLKNPKTDKQTGMEKSDKGTEWKSDLIELYKNAAVVNSDDSILAGATKRQSTHNRNDMRSSYTVQPAQPEMPIEYTYRPALSPIHENGYYPQAQYDRCRTPRMYDPYYKNYQLPTIASKMKQVAKNYFTNFNFRTIPFVAAKSTSPSHNLGINIQQVLSIIKGRKPLIGISPTLAYNIELAANKLGSRPFSALVSTLGSRMNPSRFPCPVGRRAICNMSNCQEIKELPEEGSESQDTVTRQASSRAVPNLGAGEGAEKVASRNQSLWTTSDSKRKERCICAPKPGVNFNDVCGKYLSGQMDEPTVHVTRRNKTKTWNNSVLTSGKQSNEIDAVPNTARSSINRRERNLKEVLQNLHDEFEKLTARYDELRTSVARGGTNLDVTKTLAEIEQLERELQNKEDEITMVMSLYKEVAALKQQIRLLKKRTSQASLVASPLHSSRRDFKDMNAAGHLTKLLRHIQQFQESLKNKQRS